MADEQNVQDEHVEEDVEEEEVEEEESEEEPEGESQDDDPYAGLSEADLKKRLAKAEKAIVKNKKPKQPQAPINKPSKGDDIPEWGQKIIQSEEKRSFGYERQLSPEQVDAVFRYNGGKAPDDKLLERPEVKAMIKAIGAKDRVAANTPRGGTAVVYKGKTFDEVMTDPKTSAADKQGAFDAARKKHGVE